MAQSCSIAVFFIVNIEHSLKSLTLKGVIRTQNRVKEIIIKGTSDEIIKSILIT